MLKVIFFASCLALLANERAARAERPIAVPRVTGPQRAFPRNVEAGLKHALVKAGLEVVDAEDLVELESAKTDRMAARDLDADYLVTVALVAVRKQFRADAKLVATKDGSVVWSVTRSYAKRSRAFKTGRSIGWLAVKQVKELRSVEPVAPAIVPKDEVEAPKAAKKKPAAIASADPRQRATEHPEDKLFRAALSGGSQLSSEYTVSVGDQATGLAYELRPTALIAGELMVNLPWLPISLEASLAYVPMLYDIDVDPAVTPDQPGARHLDVAASIGYGFRFWLFALRPLLGITYRSLAVQKQEPIDVVVGSSAIAPHVGLRAGLRIGDVTMEARGLFRLIVSYEETPDSTGERGFGTSYLVGAAARYWITDYLGAYADVAYDFTRVGFEGAGTRIKFEGDPELMNATVFAAEIRAAVGVTFAL